MHRSLSRWIIVEAAEEHPGISGYSVGIMHSIHLSRFQDVHIYRSEDFIPQSIFLYGILASHLLWTLACSQKIEVAC